MSTHARLSPSGANRWLSCTGSVEAERHAVELDPFLAEKSNVHADTGTLAHLMAETALEHGITSAAESFKTMGAEVDKYLEYVRFHQSPTSHLYIEQRLKLSDQIWGTADAVIFDEGHLHIIDLKYGRSKVKAENNTQLMIYALAAIKTFKKAHRVKRVTVHIGQPRINNFDSWSPTLKQLKELKKEVKTKGKIALAGKGELVYNSGHCFFCLAKPTCEEFARGTCGFKDETNAST